MASLDVIRTLTMRFKTEGADAAVAATDKLKASQEGLAKASVQTEKATLSVDAALQKTRNQVDQAARAQSQLAQVQKTLSAAREQGKISQEEQNRLMQLSIRHFNSASDAARNHSQALQELSSVGQGLAGNLGTLGGILSRMGPAGLAVAAGIGATVGIFAAASVAALKFAEDMGKLADTADTIGFTVEQLRALQITAGEVGVSTEQLDTGLGKFTAFLGQLRDGSKAAIETANRLSPGLAAAGREAKTTGEAFELFTKALRDADTAGAALGAKEIFGKAGLGFVRIAGATKSLDELVQNMNKLDIVTGQQAKEWDQLGDSISKNMKQAGTNVVSSFATPVLTALEQVSNIILELSRTFKLLVNPLADSLDTSAIDNFLIELQVLNFEIEKFGAAKATTNLSDRLFGADITAFVTTTIGEIKALIAVFAELVNIVSAAASALKGFATGNFAAVGDATARVTAAYANLNAIIFQTGKTAETAGAQVQNLNEVQVQGVQTVSDSAREWFTWTNQINKANNIVPPVTTNVGNLGKANDLAAGKTKKLKEETEKLDPVLKELGNVAGQLASSLVSAFLKGDSAAKALKTTLQSITSSATGSAINKLVTGDFSGAAVSGGIALGAGILSFLFGDDEEDKKNQEEVARQQAESAALVKRVTEAWAALADELEAFERQAAGITEGTLRRSIDAWKEQEASLQAAAAAAGDAAGSARVAAAGFLGLNRILGKFFENVDVAIKEFGESGTVLNARAAVKALKDDYDSLTQDIITFSDAVGSAEFKMAKLAELQQEGIEGFLNLLDISEPLSEVEQQVIALNAVADELVLTLQDLGLSAEAAADAVDKKLNVALQKLQGDFLGALIRDINQLAGAGFINDAEDLLIKVAKLNQDATALGLETTKIQTFFILAAQNIIDQNQLVGDSFLFMERLLGTAKGALHEFNAAIEDTTDVIVRSAQEIADAIQSNEDRLFLAIHRSDSLEDQLLRFDLAAQREREAEIKAGGQALASLERALAQERLNIIQDFAERQAEEAKRAAEEAERARQQQIEAEQRAAEERARIIKEAVDFIAGQVRRIQDFIADFLSSPESILKPSEQLAAAQQHFASELSAAASGNRDALSNITGNAQNVIDAVRRYYGSSAAGQGLIQQLLGQLQGLPSQLSPEEFIVEELSEVITDLGTTITDVTLDQTDILAALLENLRMALQTGDAQAFALALLPLFDQLDTTMDQALSFEELLVGLGSNFDTGTLDRIFKELDGNGNGLLEKSELIKAATTGTETKVTQTNALLDAIRVQTEYLRSIDLHVSYCDHLGTIVQWAPGSSHAKGGWISGGIPGQDSVHARLMPGEFVVREAIAKRNPWLEGFNATGLYPANDNTVGVVGAIHGLERSLLRGIAALIETQLQTAGIISKPIEDANKLQRTRRGEKKKAA